MYLARVNTVANRRKFSKKLIGKNDQTNKMSINDFLNFKTQIRRCDGQFWRIFVVALFLHDLAISGSPWE